MVLEVKKFIQLLWSDKLAGCYVEHFVVVRWPQLLRGISSLLLYAMQDLFFMKLSIGRSTLPVKVQRSGTGWKPQWLLCIYVIMFLLLMVSSVAIGQLLRNLFNLVCVMVFLIY